MRLEEQISQLENIGLKFFDFVTADYLRGKIHWKEWWQFDHPPFEELMLALFMGYDDEILTERYLSLDLESPLPNAYSLIIRQFARMSGVSKQLKVDEELAELYRPTPGGLYRRGSITYRFQGNETTHYYDSYFDTMDGGIVKAMLNEIAAGTKDDGHRFYYMPNERLFYLTDEAENSPLLEHLGNPIPFPIVD